MIETKQVHAVVIAIFVHGNRVFINQRTAPPMLEGKWEFAGGKVEYGETLTQALEREIEEELNVGVTVGPLVYATTSTYTNHNVLLFFRCTMIGDVDQGKCVTLEELREHDTLPDSNMEEAAYEALAITIGRLSSRAARV